MTTPASDYIRNIVCGWPEPERSQRLLVMLQGYSDDRGSDGTRLPCILAVTFFRLKSGPVFQMNDKQN